MDGMLEGDRIVFDDRPNGGGKREEDDKVEEGYRDLRRAEDGDNDEDE